ncbi:uncharacterized protein LOC133522651 [Cydia pomonella]|uniref:uncharacterized protein LOC133522651 n=1 Tax=Cydia pomonella TaxID=82600 RepID=UPI002ADE212C|nr:uncharacterized protein LOC133522651 [Cydia pomonella]
MEINWITESKLWFLDKDHKYVEGIVIAINRYIDITECLMKVFGMSTLYTLTPDNNFDKFPDEDVHLFEVGTICRQRHTAIHNNAMTNEEKSHHSANICKTRLDFIKRRNHQREQSLDRVISNLKQNYGVNTQNGDFESTQLLTKFATIVLIFNGRGLRAESRRSSEWVANEINSITKTKFWFLDKEEHTYCEGIVVATCSYEHVLDVRMALRKSEWMRPQHDNFWQFPNPNVNPFDVLKKLNQREALIDIETVEKSSRKQVQSQLQVVSESLQKWICTWLKTNDLNFTKKFHMAELKDSEISEMSIRADAQKLTAIEKLTQGELIHRSANREHSEQNTVTTFIKQNTFENRGIKRPAAVEASIVSTKKNIMERLQVETTQNREEIKKTATSHSKINNYATNPERPVTAEFSVVVVFNGNRLEVQIWTKAHLNYKGVKWITETKFWCLNSEYFYQEGIVVAQTENENNIDLRIGLEETKWIMPNINFDTFPDKRVPQEDVRKQSDKYRLEVYKNVQFFTFERQCKNSKISEGIKYFEELIDKRDNQQEECATATQKKTSENLGVKELLTNFATIVILYNGKSCTSRIWSKKFCLSKSMQVLTDTKFWFLDNNTFDYFEGIVVAKSDNEASLDLRLALKKTKWINPNDDFHQFPDTNLDPFQVLYKLRKMRDNNYKISEGSFISRMDLISERIVEWERIYCQMPPKINHVSAIGLSNQNQLLKNLTKVSNKPTTLNDTKNNLSPLSEKDKSAYEHRTAAVEKSTQEALIQRSTTTQPSINNKEKSEQNTITTLIKNALERREVKRPIAVAVNVVSQKKIKTNVEIPQNREQFKPIALKYKNLEAVEPTTELAVVVFLFYGKFHSVKLYRETDWHDEDISWITQNKFWLLDKESHLYCEGIVVGKCDKIDAPILKTAVEDSAKTHIKRNFQIFPDENLKAANVIDAYNHRRVTIDSEMSEDSTVKAETLRTILLNYEKWILIWGKQYGLDPNHSEPPDLSITTESPKSSDEKQTSETLEISNIHHQSEESDQKRRVTRAAVRALKDGRSLSPQASSSHGANTVLLSMSARRPRTRPSRSRHQTSALRSRPRTRLRRNKREVNLQSEGFICNRKLTKWQFLQNIGLIQSYRS